MSHIANRATSNPNKQVKKNLFKTEIRPALFYLSNRIIWIWCVVLCDEFQHKYSEVRMPDAGIKYLTVTPHRLPFFKWSTSRV